jgi:hypothetical protein
VANPGLGDSTGLKSCAWLESRVERRGLGPSRSRWARRDLAGGRVRRQLGASAHALYRAVLGRADDRVETRRLKGFEEPIDCHDARRVRARVRERTIPGTGPCRQSTTRGCDGESRLELDSRRGTRPPSAEATQFPDGGRVFAFGRPAGRLVLFRAGRACWIFDREAR